LKGLDDLGAMAGMQPFLRTESPDYEVVTFPRYGAEVEVSMRLIASRGVSPTTVDPALRALPSSAGKEVTKRLTNV